MFQQTIPGRSTQCMLLPAVGTRTWPQELSAGRPQHSTQSVCLRKAYRLQGSRRHATAFAEAPASEQGAADPVSEGTWFAVVANSDFMLHDVQNESFAEQLRERRRLFKDKNQALDFWLVSEPAWLDAQFPSEAKRVRRPCVALVSTDEIWINFMKLRLDRVLRLDLGAKKLDDVLRSNTSVPDYEPLDRNGTWTAPYPPYRPGWWDAFMRKG